MNVRRWDVNFGVFAPFLEPFGKLSDGGGKRHRQKSEQAEDYDSDQSKLNAESIADFFFPEMGRSFSWAEWEPMTACLFRCLRVRIV